MSSYDGLTRKGITYAQLVGKLADLGVMDSEPNIRNKISRGNLQRCFSYNVWRQWGRTTYG